jgi:hypothetical protein
LSSSETGLTADVAASVVPELSAFTINHKGKTKHERQSRKIIKTATVLFNRPLPSLAYFVSVRLKALFGLMLFPHFL